MYQSNSNSILVIGNLKTEVHCNSNSNSNRQSSNSISNSNIQSKCWGYSDSNCNWP